MAFIFIPPQQILGLHQLTSGNPPTFEMAFFAVTLFCSVCFLMVFWWGRDKEQSASSDYDALRKYYSEEDLRHYEECTLITNRRIIEKSPSIAGDPDDVWLDTLKGTPIKREMSFPCRSKTW